MSAIRVTVRAPRSELSHWLTMGGFSVALHAATFAAILFAPQFFRPKLKFPEVYTVDLVSLPAGDPGPPAEGPRSSAPAAAAPAPAPPEPAVKIPEKPQVSPKPKPVPKKEPPKPKIEKVAKKDKPAPKPRAAAPEPSKPVESAGSSREGTGDAKSAGTAPTGGSAAAGGGPGIPGATGPGGAGGTGMLDDPSFEYGRYLSNMTAILRRNWSRPVRPDLDRTISTKIHFRVLKDGTLADIEIVEPSGDAAVDRTALRAVQASNPLPPLPFQWTKDDLGLVFVFEVTPD